jgi:predicted phosphodiesterase
MELVSVDIIFMGHTHRPYIRRMNKGKILANPGSTGQPRDGDPRPSYIVFDVGSGTGIIERVSYDYEITIRLVKEAGLPDVLGERLRKGK